MKLLKSSPEDIKKLFDQYEEDIAGLKKAALTMAWHMRGGATYEDILNMSLPEREEIGRLIDEHLEITKKSQMPYF